MSKKARSDWEKIVIEKYFHPLSYHTVSNENNLQNNIYQKNKFNLSDDVARLPRLSRNEVWSITTDTAQPNIHYPIEEQPSCAVRRAIRRNISDMCACGATPVCWLCTLILPLFRSEEWIQAWLTEFTATASEEQSKYNILLIGGDLSIAKCNHNFPIISITMFGKNNRSSTMQRYHAKPDDLCFLSSSIGDSALGLHCKYPKYSIFKNKYLINKLSSKLQNNCWRKYSYPNPPIEIGYELSRLTRCATIDISDGLIADIGKIATLSNISINIDFSLIPLSTASKFWLELTKDPALILNGGDDYELFFTLPKELITDKIKSSCYIVGKCIKKETNPVNILNLENYCDFNSAGYNHSPK